MHHRAIRFAACSLVLAFAAYSVAHGQTPAPKDIYEHFIGTWVGTDAYIEDGITRQIGVKIVITETKKKDRLQLDYIFGQKGTPDFDRETKFLKLDPTKAKLDIQWKGSSKETYKAAGLDEFSKSGFGKFTGSITYPHKAEQNRFFRVIFELTDSTFSYEWQNGPDEDHLVFRSIFTLNRSAVTGQP